MSLRIWTSQTSKKNSKKKQKLTPKTATEGLFSFSKYKPTKTKVHNDTLGDLTRDSSFKSNNWYVELTKPISIRLFGKEYNVTFTFHHEILNKSDYSEELLEMTSAIPDKALAAYRKIINGWMKTSSFNKRIKDELMEDKEYEIDDGAITLSKDSDFSAIFTPTSIDLYTNGTMIMFLKDSTSESGYQIILSPKFELLDGYDDEGLRMAGSMNRTTPGAIRSYYEKNR